VSDRAKLNWPHALHSQSIWLLIVRAQFESTLNCSSSPFSSFAGARFAWTLSRFSNSSICSSALIFLSGIAADPPASDEQLGSATSPRSPHRDDFDAGCSDVSLGSGRLVAAGGGADEPPRMRPLASASAMFVRCSVLPAKCVPSNFSVGNCRLHSMQHHLPVVALSLISGLSPSSIICLACSSAADAILAVAHHRARPRRSGSRSTPEPSASGGALLASF